MRRAAIAASALMAILAALAYPQRSELYMDAAYGKRILFDQVSCPPQTARTLVLVTFGQSNAANSGEYRHTAGPRVVNFFRGRCFRAEDPLLGSQGVHGSVWAILGDLLSSDFDWVILSPAAVAGTPIERWTGDLSERLGRRVSDLRRHGYHPTHFLWHQGESNALVTDPAIYARFLRELISRARATSPDSTFIVAAASQCGPVRDPKLIDAQRSVVSPGDRVYPGPNTDQLAADDRRDGCHFSRKGQELVARMWASSIVSSVANERRSLERE